MDLLSDDRTPSETLNYAHARERGQANQQKMHNSQPSQSHTHTDNPWFEKIQYIKRRNRGPILPTPQTGQIKNCRRCGNKFLPGHLNICPAKTEACRICKKIGHFAKLCRSEMPPRPTYRPQQRQQRMNTGSQPPQRYNQLAQRQTQQKIRNLNKETETEEQTETDETIDPESTCYIREMMEDWQNINFITSINFTNEKVSDVNKSKRGEFWIKTRTNDQQIFWLADTGSPRSLMNIDTAQKLLANGKTAIRHPNKTIGELRCFNNKKIDIIGTIQVDITSGSSNAKNCTILLVNNNTINIMGRNIKDQLGLQLTMTTTNKVEKNLFNISNTHQRIYKWIFNKYPHLCTRLGRSKNHAAKSIFKKDFQPTQHKGRRIPLHLTEKVERELKKLIDKKQIKKLTKCSDEHFISPVVITVKSDQSIKIALDSKILNDAIHKNKYQMQSLDHLMDKIGMKISELKTQEGNLYFSKIDLKYAYSQLPLHPDTQKHCNFNILGGNATGTYKFLNGFYGLTDLPATFQKMMDTTLDGLDSTNAFLDDIIIITKGTIEKHEEEIDKTLNRLREENLAISLHKCEFGLNEIIWLGYKIHAEGIKPTKRKTDAIIQLENPKTLKQLRSFMGSIHHLIKFLPNLATLSAPIRPLLSSSASKKKLDLNDKHSAAFKNIKNAIQNIIELKHFTINNETRVKCDASKEGLGACLEQKENSNWQPIAYASRFLNKVNKDTV